jgi:hypothetical protein
MINPAYEHIAFAWIFVLWSNQHSSTRLLSSLSMQPF